VEEVDVLILDKDFIESATGLAALLSYDAMWTSYTNDPGLAERNPLAMFESALAFRRQLIQAADYADRIAEVARDGQFSEPSASLIEALSSEDIGVVVLDALRSHDNSVAALAESGAAEIRAATPEELELIEVDARKIVTGQLAAGNLFGRFLCGLAEASMAAGLVTVWVPPHLHAPAAVAFGATVYKSANCQQRAGRGRASA
jgi:hypothetical protein